MKKRATPCPCGSGSEYADCCGPFVDAGEPAPTAEALMRSRYCAYAMGNAAYLRDTWHPGTRPAHLDTEGPHWIGLTVTATEGGGSGDTHGRVTFVARYLSDGCPGELRERSRFVREGGLWFYVDGEYTPGAVAGAGRNAPCPCGSGRKFKRCCGASKV